MRLKRSFDILFGLLLLLFISPIIITFCLIVFLYDKNNPLYISKRIGLNGKPFKIFKIRSMVINADKLGGTSTSKRDKRLLPVGNLIRKLKLDEFTQVINVLNGSMSFVGPRPNTPFDVNLYSSEEKVLLSVRPGITDFSSIVFSDEGNILDKYSDPDLAYNQLIRPWKSRLGLFYVEKRNFLLDIQLIFLTFLNSFYRTKVLILVSKLVKKYGGSSYLVAVSKRQDELKSTPPPGFKDPISKI